MLETTNVEEATHVACWGGVWPIQGRADNVIFIDHLFEGTCRILISRVTGNRYTLLVKL